MSTQRAKVEWDGEWWVAVPDAGGVTQARRLDQLPARIVEVISLMTGEKIDPGEVVLDVDYDGRRITDLRDRRAKLAVEEEALQEATIETARALRAQGMNLRDIATATGISHQRVHQLLAHTEVATIVRRAASS
jgi:hypothetical protein